MRAMHYRNYMRAAKWLLFYFGLKYIRIKTMLASYSTKLKGRKEIARATMAFYFEKPKGFNFVAGQHITMTQTATNDNKRVFCMASAPHEKDLIFAMRMRDSEFKNSLKVMPIGTGVEITEARGLFTLHNDASRPAAFLVGGIGITPFRSMALQAAYEKLPHKIFMFYSNYTLEDAAFLTELRELESKNPNYKFIATMTELDSRFRGNDNYETSYINKAMLEKYIEDVKLPVYYIAGPERFVGAMRNMLQDLNINANNIKTDEFEGY